MPAIVTKSPGRICLLGDNADLLEKPAIAATVSAYLTCELEPRADKTVRIVGRDIGAAEDFIPGTPVPMSSKLRYTMAVINRLKRHITGGFELRLSSEIPISAGLSSSTAVCIASIKAVAKAFGLAMSAAEVAELAFRVENEDLGVECGRMDQYAIAFGGVTYIHTDADARVEPLRAGTLPVLVADTREKHDTKALQVWLRKRIAEREPLLMDSLARVSGLVEEGRKAIEQGDMAALGRIMSAQQVQEKRMGTSTERLELLCVSAMNASALGAKQMGAGGGGCMIALCGPCGIEPVRRALESHGAPVWSFEIVGGA